MKTSLFLLLILLVLRCDAVVYDAHEINAEVNSLELRAMTQSFTQNYFTAKQPNQVIADLLDANISPLQREYVLQQLLTEISQQPPQDFHQDFVDLMKTYPTAATMAADEGPYPVAIFNLNSQAHGIENIWLAYRSEQRFNQLFDNDISTALVAIKGVIAAPTEQRRPQWLGIKNSLANLSVEKLAELSHHISTEVKVNAGFDQLISHVGLQTANVDLLEKALSSNQRPVREYTLRHLSAHLNAFETKSMLMSTAISPADARFRTSLLAQYPNDKSAQNFLMQQLKNELTADTAAFALSRSTDNTLPERLKNRFLKSNETLEKNHLLLALQLNQSSTARLIVSDLKRLIKPNSASSQWLKSFSGAEQ